MVQSIREVYYIRNRGCSTQRKGREIERNRLWLERIESAKNSITLVGTTHGGWFIRLFDALIECLPDILNQIDGKMEVFLLNPLGKGFKLREEDEEIGREKTELPKERIISVLKNIKKIMTTMPNYYDDKDKQKSKISFYFYDSVPISITRIDNELFVGIYLPRIPNRWCPELKIISLGKFAEQFNKCIEKIREDSKTKRLREKDIDEIIRKLQGRKSKRTTKEKKQK